MEFKNSKTLKYKNMDLLNLDHEFKENYFDKIFCLSTLEKNNHDNVIKILKQFKKCLKNNGKIIITCHHPYLRSDTFISLVDKAGLIFYGSVDMEIYKETVLRGQDSCKCYRAVLEINKDEINNDDIENASFESREKKIEKIQEVKPITNIETK
jgi:SAM-dependent methyltransferase